MTFLARVLPRLVLVLALTGCSATETVAPTQISLDVTATAPSEPREEEVPLGSVVTLVVTSEMESLVHVHGFEEKVEVAAGETAEAIFTANMTGAFEVETHDPDAVWIKLVVS